MVVTTFTINYLCEPLTNQETLQALTTSHITFICFQEQRVFSWYDGTLKASDTYIGRINLLGNHYGLGRASVNLSSIRESGRYSDYYFHVSFS